MPDSSAIGSYFSIAEGATYGAAGVFGAGTSKSHRVTADGIGLDLGYERIESPNLIATTIARTDTTLGFPRATGTLQHDAYFGGAILGLLKFLTGTDPTQGGGPPPAKTTYTYEWANDLADINNKSLSIEAYTGTVAIDDPVGSDDSSRLIHGVWVNGLTVEVRPNQRVQMIWDIRGNSWARDTSPAAAIYTTTSAIQFPRDDQTTDQVLVYDAAGTPVTNLYVHSLTLSFQRNWNTDRIDLNTPNVLGQPHLGDFSEITLEMELDHDRWALVKNIEDDFTGDIEVNLGEQADNESIQFTLRQFSLSGNPLPTDLGPARVTYTAKASQPMSAGAPNLSPLQIVVSNIVDTGVYTQ